MSFRFFDKVEARHLSGVGATEGGCNADRMYAAPRWTAAATSKAISGVAPALRSNAAGTQQKAGAKRGMAIDKQHTNDGSGQVSPWKSGRGLGAVKRGMPMLPEAGMLIRRAEILLVRGWGGCNPNGVAESPEILRAAVNNIL